VKPGSADRLVEAVAYLGFLALFPGFVVYHYTVSLGWIPALLGGLFGIATLVMLPVAGFSLAARVQGQGAGRITLEKLFAFFIAYLIAWIGIEALIVSNRAYALDAVKEALVTLCIWVSVFFVGFRMQLESRPARLGVIASALVLAGILLHAVVAQESVLGPWLAFQGGDDTSDGSDGAAYQSVGRSILVTGIICASLQLRFWKQAVILCLSTLGLLVLGSRAHLLGSATTIIALTVVAITKRSERPSATLLLIALLAGGYALTDLFLQSRASEILDLAQSTSWQARSELQTRAFEVVGEHPVFGDFGYHHRAGPLAGYAHNILSAWAGFGVLVFALYAGLILYSLSISARKVLTQERCSTLWLISFQLNLVALALAIASEPIYSSAFPALGWGFTANALRIERRRSAPLIQRAIATAHGGVERRDCSFNSDSLLAHGDTRRCAE